MNPVTWSALSHESLIGPPSELVDVGDFLRGARDSLAPVFTPSTPLQQAVADIDPAQHGAIMSECSVDDVRSKLVDIFNDPRLYVHARRVHDTSVNAIYEQAERNTSKKRKRKREVVSELEDTPDLTALKKGLADVKLKSWPLPPEAAVFMRGPKNSDINTLAEIKYSSNGSNPLPQSTVVVISVYNRLAWSYNFVYRSSQHVVLSSNTLEELHNVIPCPSNEIPDECVVDGTFVRYGTGSSTRPSGCVVVIEEMAYGDGSTEADYARYVHLSASTNPNPHPRLCSKLVAHVSKPFGKGPKMRDTSFSSLSLRLNHPYWLVHQGNCEHFLVVDQIRHVFWPSLLHPHDPPSGYPLTTQITPPLLGNCRACTKVPAVYSVVGDIRLGESPCLLCAPCWRNMGLPKGKDANAVMVIPLPKHEFGW
ncbi:snRNA-activating protein of 50kDa MW C terminal-domain-containing protein [Lactarius indigo]|nr:snRNA-activating protein of 50kDa MW C terminal-domain-containing protein [Lactarius indigo]